MKKTFKTISNQNLLFSYQNPQSESKSSKRPPRLCIFCGEMVNNSKLTNHIKAVHKNEARVQDALSSDNMKKKFDTFKTEGILQYNKKETASEIPVYQRERAGKNQEALSKCSQCNKFISISNFTRHKKTCAKQDMIHPTKISSISLKIIQISSSTKSTNQAFIEDILNKLRDDKIGKLCRTDEIIVRLGEIFYGKIKRKKDKKVQVSLEKCYLTRWSECIH